VASLTAARKASDAREDALAAELAASPRQHVRELEPPAGMAVADDAPLLAWARQLAPRLLASHPEAARAQIERWLGHKAEYLKA
jgi:hypothetical protein